MNDASPASPPPAAALMQILTGRWISHAACVAAELGIADLLKNGPRDSDSLAADLELNADATYRLLRALTVVGIFVEHDGRKFTNSPLGELLRSDVPGSMRATGRFIGHTAHYSAWGDLLGSVRTGEPAFDRHHGVPVFEYTEKNPDFGDLFNAGMTSFSTMETGAILAGYDFSGIRHLVDVGGGHGFLIAAILRKYPEMHGTVFDLPRTSQGARQTFADAGLADRTAVVSGDFFTSPIPSGCDACILKHVIHDWNDDACVKILSACRDALPVGGKVLLAETLITPPNDQNFAKILDLEMLVMTDGGRERTADEFSQLYSKAGLQMERVIPTPSHVVVIEGVKG